MPTSPGSPPNVGTPSPTGPDKNAFQTRELAIVFTDIKDSVAYFAKHGDAAGARMIRVSQDVVCSVAREFGGTVAYSVGDSVMCVFAEARAAALAAGAIQVAISKINEDRLDSGPIAIGIGLSYGPTIIDSHDVFGDVVNVAARLKGLSGRNQIVMSESFQQQLDSSSPCKVRFVGKYVLRGRDENLSVYELVWNDDAVALTPTRLTFVRDFSAVPKFQLQQISSDGSVSQTFDIGTQLSIGRSEGDVTFAADSSMSPLHARLSVQGYQMYLEECGASPVFISISGDHVLNDADVLKIGSQLFEVNNHASTGDSAKLSVPDRTNSPELVSVRDRSNTFPIGPEGITVGRTTGTYVFEDDALMSRTHAKVFIKESAVHVEDLGSRNGTFVRVRGKVLIAPGTKILAGTQILRLGIQGDDVGDRKRV